MEKQNNKYLTFELGVENYAIPILKVREIIGMLEMTHVPRLPEFITGVVNLRGKIIPVIDLRLKFGLEKREYDEKTSTIVVEIETSKGVKASGIIVDVVSEVLDIAPDNIEPPPQYGQNVEQDFLMGMGKADGKVIMLLDVNKILTSGELKQLEKVKEK